MAEIIVKFVVNKLAEILLNEAQLLGGVSGQVERMQRELSRIQCFLRDADSKRKGDVRVQNWLNELRDVAYRIEDATDTFFQGAEDHRPRSFRDRFLKNIHMPIRKTIEMPVLLHRLGTELHAIEKVLEEIAKSRVDYGIESLQDKGKEEAVILPFRRAVYQEVDETEIVGLEAHTNNILKQLNHEETHRRTVITIVGPGGLGKTTLAQMVYKRLRAGADFEYHIMLSISQRFSLNDLLRKMLSRYECAVPDKQEVGFYIDKVRKLLYSKRYLVVLDDVWGVDLWNHLKQALPDDKNGSRVLITSRFINVARSADSKMAPYELKFLDDKESVDLLLKKALPYREPDEECPSDLLEVADELSKKCKGLPLALIVLGGILSTKDTSYTEWERVLRTMDWHLDGKECMKVLAMSYEDMPYYLKACFLYLASFPEDYEISAKRLIRMWVAEGFIPQENRKTEEETAEDCLNELFQRCLVEVRSRHANGSIKYFRMHDLLRDLAMHEAWEENFLTVFTKTQKLYRSNTRITRRASFQFYSNPSMMDHISSNTRSFIWFGTILPKFSKFSLLKVLEMEGVKVRNELRGFETLIHLRYLGFRNGPPVENPSDFACVVCSLKNLETLDFRGTDITLEGLWTISTLRHVLFSSIKGPLFKADLRNLQSLKWITIPEGWHRKLPCLDSLRKLGLMNPFNNWDVVNDMLATLPCLISLGITGTSSIPEKIVYPGALPNYQNLQTLYLDGKWSPDVVLRASLFPRHLVKLTLARSNLQQDPMPELGKLKSLKKLCLTNGAYRRTKMVCGQGFPVLQYLEAQNRRDAELQIAKGAMPNLKYLETCWGCNLQMPPELEHVTVNFRSYNYSYYYY